MDGGLGHHFVASQVLRRGMSSRCWATLVGEAVRECQAAAWLAYAVAMASLTWMKAGQLLGEFAAAAEMITEMDCSILVADQSLKGMVGKHAVIPR